MAASDIAKPPPAFPRARFSDARVERGDGEGCLLVSLASGRRFFCPEGSRSHDTQFGAVCKVYEAWCIHGDSDKFSEDLQDVEGSSVVFFNGRAFRYYLARPMALKTSRVDMLKLEACYQQRELGELTGEDPLKEVAALQLVQSHPNLEELEEAITDGTNLYKVTPWYEGGELFDLAPMPENSAKDVFAQLLEGLEFLHSQGVCHRDISLENVLMDTRMPDRRSVAAYRSGSVSSNGSCFSIASSTSAFSCNESASPRSCFDNAYSDDTSPRGLMGSSRERRDEDSPVLSNDADLEPGTTAAGTRGPGIGRPRLCDFGMSVRIPTSKSGKRVPVTPQGRCGKNTCVAPEVFYDEAFDAEAVDTWSLGTTLFMALLGVQPWEEVGDYKFQAIAEGKNLEVVLEGWKLRHLLSQDAVDLLQSLLTANPKERLSNPKTILSHPWFTS